MCVWGGKIATKWRNKSCLEVISGAVEWKSTNGRDNCPVFINANMLCFSGAELWSETIRDTERKRSGRGGKRQLCLVSRHFSLYLATFFFPTLLWDKCLFCFCFFVSSIIIIVIIPIITVTLSIYPQRDVPI